MNNTDSICSFETHELETYSEAKLHGASDDLLRNFQKLVKYHLALNDGSEKYFLVIAKTTPASIAGYLFYFQTKERKYCYLLSVYVDKEFRGVGLAYKLFCNSISYSHRLGSRRFEVQFLDEKALGKSLAKKLLRHAADYYKDSVFCFSQQGNGRSTVKFGIIESVYVPLE